MIARQIIFAIALLTLLDACALQQIQNTPTPMPKAGDERVIGGAPMVFVPEGEFLMGASDIQAQAALVQLLEVCSVCQADALDDLKPQHTIFLDVFWIDKFEVTNAQYKKCVDAGKCQAPSVLTSNTRQSYFGNSDYDNFPVLYVSWQEAKTFCEWASKRLPTEAEWEKAARGTDGRNYPWGESWSDVQINIEERIRDTASVGNYPDDTSPYGVMDMGSDVREWVADWYVADYYANSPQKNPQGPDSGQFRMVRGGSWGAYRFSALTFFRGYWEPETREHYIGIRCAKSVTE